MKIIYLRFHRILAVVTLSGHQLVYAHEINSPRFDCGSIAGFLDAILHFYLKDKKMAPEYKKVIKKYIS